MSDRTWAVFSKPWAMHSADDLGPLIRGMGFSAVEIPVREGAWLTPGAAEAELGAFVRRLAEQGVEVISIASEPTEQLLAACAAAGVPMIRVMAPIDARGYPSSTRRLRSQWESLAPLLQRYDVRLGVQPHHGRYVSSVLGVLELITDLPENFCVVWDAAHDALAGENPAYTLEQAGDRLGLVNLKNAEYRHADDLSDGSTRYRTWFDAGDRGMADWPLIMETLHRIDYRGPICLTAQYSERSADEAATQAAVDLAWARSLE